VRSTDKFITVVFKSDASGTGSGFAITLMSVRAIVPRFGTYIVQKNIASNSIRSHRNDTNVKQIIFSFETDKCGTNITSGSGTITFPNYPNNYPNNARCIWRIISPNGRVREGISSMLSLK